MKVRDLIIIGAGPAGMSAGIYAARSALSPLIIESQMPGGKVALTDFIENYPAFPNGMSGQELTKLMEEQCNNFNVEFMNFVQVDFVEKENKIFKLKTNRGDFFAKTVIVATGASPAELGIPGEREFKGRGVSYCATCDGPLFKDKDILVVGGGDSAVQEAIYLTKFVSSLKVVHRRDKLRARKMLQEKAFKNPKIDILWNSNLLEIKGKDLVETVVIFNNKTNQKREIRIDGVFMYVGFKPNSSLVKDLVEMDKLGRIITDHKMRTSTTGLFAAGDVRNTPLRQVVTAVSDGAIAAINAEEYLEYEMKI
ncbi:MAG: thioredoxin-disulfide reductase [Actinobacteria bacterium]|nr:thioredoxin-disulfide reductase [Actinomycetota bacterium]